MNEHNPYAVSPEFSGAADASFDGTSPTQFQVSGDLLICGSKVILPPVCVVTGDSHDLVTVSQQTQFPSFKIVVIQRSCHVVYWLSRRIQKRRRLLATIFATLIGLGIAEVFVGSQLNSQRSGLIGFLGITGWAAILVGMICLAATTHTLKLVRYEAPNTYWVRGFNKGFLSKVSAMQQSAELPSAGNVNPPDRLHSAGDRTMPPESSTQPTE